MSACQVQPHDSTLKVRQRTAELFMWVCFGMLCIVIFVCLEFSLNLLVSFLQFAAYCALSSQFFIRLCRFGGDICGRGNVTFDIAKCVAKRTLLEFNYSTRAFMAVVLVAIIINGVVEPPTPFRLDLARYCASVLAGAAIIILTEVLFLNESTTWRSHTMTRMNSLDYGSAMAYSYFHGYLKIILPSKGDNNHSLTNRIEIFMDSEGISHADFPVKKLVVLVPSSGFCSPRLNDDQRLKQYKTDIECSMPFLDTLRDRAGSERRVYRGSAYKIRIRPQSTDEQDRFMYVVAEGATPVQTFYEAFSSGCKNADYLREHKEEVIEMFCSTLKELISYDHECRDLAEVIYFNDETTNTYFVLEKYLLEQGSFSNMY